ncbi:hypothetical protein [Methylorubrum salsuginis]|uniref:DUF2946 domain-containing protein n=1 Tax=Methylorubrum salsuginis TaxID=414703 RepID=A0A1I3Z359_9HYPH|nr:hypothetical protein [Methylorubrum salsuginis]SFK38101.1 hypothetical protein SAMN04488125_101467 [Methylorubrum salsuginis]
MRLRPPRFVTGRAIIGVIALYALVLQAFLGALAPISPAMAGDVLCAEHGVGAGTPDDPAPACHHACCIQAQAPQLGLPPTPIAVAVAEWPQAAAVTPWPPTEHARARAPPDPAVGPRGPPAA